MPTFIGVIFLLLSLYSFTKGSSHLFSLLVFSGIFQAATVISSSVAGLEPYYLVALFFLARCGLEIALKTTTFHKIKGLYPLVALACIGAVSAVLCPYIFRGMPVYSPPLGLDVGLFTHPPLEAHPHIGSAFLLAINTLVVLAAAKVPGRIAAPARSFLLAFWVLLLIILLQVTCLHAGIPFPSEIFNNNQHWSIANPDLGGSLRPNGTFTEPSTASCMLIAVMLGSMAMFMKNGKGALLMGASLLGVLLIASTSAFLALWVGVAIVVLGYPLLRFPFYLRKGRLKRYGILALLSICALSALAIPVVWSNVMDQTVNKSATSLSFATRLAADMYALRVAYDTFGIGVGLGSTRASSLVSTLLSTIGVAGFAAFIIMVGRIFQNELGEYFWLKWAALGLILNMAFGVADISFPLLWVPLALIARAAQPLNCRSGMERVRAGSAISDK
jgi:hypothetical protein